jgi:hypothetical protein
MTRLNNFLWRLGLVGGGSSSSSTSSSTRGSNARKKTSEKGGGESAWDTGRGSAGYNDEVNMDQYSSSAAAGRGSGFGAAQVELATAASAPDSRVVTSRVDFV